MPRRRCVDRELRAISNCNQALLRATDEQSLLEEICRIVCEEAGYRMAWVREAFPYESPVRLLLLDHDAKYGVEVPAAIRSMNISPLRTAVGCPWQNGVAERWVGSCRRELLDHVIAINEAHLKRLLAAYVDYYHQDRIHCGLQKQTPVYRTHCVGRGKVVAFSRVGGLHHRYDRAA